MNLNFEPREFPSIAKGQWQLERWEDEKGSRKLSAI